MVDLTPLECKFYESHDLGLVPSIPTIMKGLVDFYSGYNMQHKG